ncbi:hypothetical protein RRF57_001719 [Xylaria bambusicola]|uniref:Uncharacterized protein n=1 Tax=Xylaria bambusicola TaxID=326684 RepID=A0AAN7Z3U4_9PEZI
MPLHHAWSSLSPSASDLREVEGGVEEDTSPYNHHSLASGSIGHRQGEPPGLAECAVFGKGPERRPNKSLSPDIASAKGPLTGPIAQGTIGHYYCTYCTFCNPPDLTKTAYAPMPHATSSPHPTSHFSHVIIVQMTG